MDAISGRAYALRDEEEEDDKQFIDVAGHAGFFHGAVGAKRVLVTAIAYRVMDDGSKRWSNFWLGTTSLSRSSAPTFPVPAQGRHQWSSPPSARTGNVTGSAAGFPISRADCCIAQSNRSLQ
jgi:hypothetical protein